MTANRWRKHLCLNHRDCVDGTVEFAERKGGDISTTPKCNSSRDKRSLLRVPFLFLPRTTSNAFVRSCFSRGDKLPRCAAIAAISPTCERRGKNTIETREEVRDKSIRDRYRSLVTKVKSRLQCFEEKRAWTRSLLNWHGAPVYNYTRVACFMRN